MLLGLGTQGWYTVAQVYCGFCRLGRARLVGAGVGGKQILPGQTQGKLKGDGVKKGPLGLLS